MKMKELKLKLLFVCVLTLLVGAPVALGDWDPADGHKMHWPQEPKMDGWDVAWTNLWSLGDDWQCSETGPVEDIHFWVSFKSGVGDPFDILSFNVEIWSNDPCGISDPCDVPWSHPDQLLWMYVYPSFTWRYVDTAPEGWFEPVQWLYNYPDHIGCWQINITDIPDPCEFIQQEGEIYWLVINDMFTVPGIEVGWKQSGSDHFMDDAVWWYGDWPPFWYEIYDPCSGASMDLAFVITGSEEEPPPVIKWEQPPDPCLCGLYALEYNMGPGMGIERQIIADDWLCEGGVVTDFHWWGAVDMPGSGLRGFQLSIHDNDDPCCLPLDPALWQADIPIGSISVTPTGMFNNCGFQIIKYEYILPQQDQFHQVQGDTYWFDVCALSNDPCFPDIWTWQEAGRSTMPILCPAAEKIEPGIMPWQSVVWQGDPCEYSDMAFAITSGEEPVPPKEPVPDLKWSQPPIEYDPTDPDPRYCGWDEPSFTDMPNEWWRIAADDFRCFGSMPIDSIHWWGSYSYWDGDEPPDVAGMDIPVIGWRIGFWSNVPAHPNNPWSHPEMLLWQVQIPPNRVQVERVGVDEHPYNGYFPETCFQYYVDLEPEEVFWQEEFLEDTQDDVFWLSIAAVYDPCDLMVYYPWGWKTRPWSWMDDGVVFELNEDPWEGMVIDPINNNMYPLEWYESYDLAFELDTDPCWIKWDQPFTGIRHWPHYEDIESWMEWWPEGITHLTVAADDWQCQGPLPVTALAWWGSYLFYEYQPDPCMVPVPPEQPAYFDVSIWTDVPDPDPCDPATWSHPGEVVWQYDVYDYDEVLVGYDKHPHDPCGPIPGPHEPVFRYTARIPEGQWFWQDEDEAVYWLSIVAVYEEHHPQYVWGWTNHEHAYNDDAVQAYPGPDKQEWYWSEILDQTGASADLSFTIYTDPYAEQLIDFGDAPDPCYPTWLFSNGARHVITGIAPWLGGFTDAPDAEGNGQPDPCSLGDDNDTQGDDEDGVVFTSPIVPGQQASVDVTVYGMSAVQYPLNAWVDFNGDGDWADPCEQIFNDEPVGSGLNFLTFQVPATATPNIYTHARFRIDSNGGLSYTGLADDGEVEDYRVYIEEPEPEVILKWSQPPFEIEPDLFYGWDEMSIYGGMQIAGDDWLCEDQRPVSDIHWWGSYYGWPIPEPPPVPLPTGFHIGIWTDVPMGDPCNMYLYSHPGRMIWEYWATMAEVNEEPVGSDFHDQHPPDACFRYDLQLPEEFWFWQEGPGNIYWLTISAIYDVQPPVDMFYWGWKTRPHFFNDDAIRIWMPTAPMVGEPYIEGEPIEDPPGVSWDLAFELTTLCPTCGDFDHNGSIDLNDLRTLAANWLWAGTPGGNITDLSCNGKIDYEDFAIFALQWLGSCP